MIPFTVSRHFTFRVILASYCSLVGARPVNRLIQHDLLNPLARLLLEGSVKSGDSIAVDATNDDKLEVKKA